MNWLKKISNEIISNPQWEVPPPHNDIKYPTSPPGTQGILPFKDFDLRSIHPYKRQVDPITGKHHCAYCNMPVEAGEKVNHWVSHDIEGKYLPPIEVISLNGNTREILPEKPVCKECEEKYIKECPYCGENILPGEEGQVVAGDGETYHLNCAEYCESCGEYYDQDSVMWCESQDVGYCENCYNQHCGANIDSIWEEFYDANPKMRENRVLERAANQDPQDPSVYVTIFEELSWNEQYGGNAWAEIARTWDKLVYLRGNQEMINSSSLTDIMLTIDHTFDLVHNNGSLFSKAKRSVTSWLMNALNAKRDMPPELWMNKLSPDIRKLFRDHYHVSPITGNQALSWARHLYETKKDTANRGIKKVQEMFQYGVNIQKTLENYKLSYADFKDTIEYVPIYLEGIGYRNTSRDVYHVLRDKDLTQFSYLIREDPVRLKERMGENMFNVLVDQLRETIITLSNVRYVATDINGQYLRRPSDWSAIMPRVIKWMSILTNNDADIMSILPKMSEIPSEVNLTDTTRESKSAQITLYPSPKIIIKLAELDQSTFYDFYALTTIDCDNFTDHKQRLCSFLKKFTFTKVVDDLLEIISRAVIREARHVNNPQAMSEY